MEQLPAKKLLPDWRASPSAPANMAIGDAWAKAQRSLILAVPSVIVPGEWTYLLHPAHPDFKKRQIARPIPFAFDPRWLGR